jgi:protein-L-isoaspartate O-methyltransferase
LQGKYDRVHCGAACPPHKLAALVDLLRPEGGLVVTPVEPSDLRVIVKAADGSVRQRIVSQVRYSTLEVRAHAASKVAGI